MSEALEQRIDQALTEALRDIRVAGGYFTDLGEHVFDEPVIEDEVDDTQKPCAFVLPGEEAPNPGCMGGTYGSLFERWVVIYAKAPVGEIKPLLYRLKADVKKRVLTDPSLGLGAGVTNEADWGGARSAIDVIEQRGIGRAALRFVIGADWSPQAA